MPCNHHRDDHYDDNHPSTPVYPHQPDAEPAPLLAALWAIAARRARQEQRRRWEARCSSSAGGLRAAVPPDVDAA